MVPSKEGNAAMFINFWYPTLMSYELTETPVQRRMLGQEFVLFRDQAGVAHCLSNVCAHRGGALAHGKIKLDSLMDLLPISTT